MNILPSEMTLEVYSYPLKVRHSTISTTKRTIIRKREKKKGSKKSFKALFVECSSINVHKISVSQTGFT